MPPRKNSAACTAVETPACPEVIVDFRFEQGLLYIALVNISAVPAYRVSVRFNKTFWGLGGDCEISSLRLFRRVEFLAPHKRIETLLDSSYAYFRRREPTLIKASVTFRDADGKARTREMVHDLKIYQDVSYLVAGGTPAALSLSAAAAQSAADSTPRKDSPYGNLKRETLRPIQLSR
jgi:hypothetical protein